MKELHELIKYLKDNGYAHLKVNPDLLVGIIEYFASKQETKQCTITDVVVELPNAKSKEFKRWTQSKGYEPAFNGLWYEKNNQTYETKLLHRAFTNEIEFGN